MNGGEVLDPRVCEPKMVRKKMSRTLIFHFYREDFLSDLPGGGGGAQGLGRRGGGLTLLLLILPFKHTKTVSVMRVSGGAVWATVPMTALACTGKGCRCCRSHDHEIQRGVDEPSTSVG